MSSICHFISPFGSHIFNTKCSLDIFALTLFLPQKGCIRLRGTWKIDKGFPPGERDTSVGIRDIMKLRLMNKVDRELLFFFC